VRRGKEGEPWNGAKGKFIKAGAGAAALALMPRALAQWQPSQRYPDPLIKIVDRASRATGSRSPRSENRLGIAAAKGRCGTRWPIPAWSDIPNNRIMKWEEEPAR